MVGLWRSNEVDLHSSGYFAGFPQATVLIVASGLISLEVAAMFLLTSMTLSVTNDFNLHHVQQGLLMSFASLGGLAGALVVGHMADRKGRRPPLLWALGSLTMFSALASFARTYHELVILGAGIGLSLGGGLVPTSVLLSETTRQDQRMAVRGVCQTLGGVIGFLMLVAVQLDDPTLQHLHWRNLLRGFGCGAAVLWGVAFFCVPESPSFLGASLRATMEARMALRDKGSPEEMTVRSQLEVVLSRRFLSTTLYIGLAGMLAGLVQGGNQYALPLILSKESSLVSAAMGRIVIACCGVPMAPAAQCTASRFSRQEALVALGLSSIVVAISAAVLGSYPSPQPAAIEVLFFMGMSVDPYRAFLGGLLFGEIGADVYPTTTAGFGASIIAVSMGVATIVAPLLFEGLKLLTGRWTTFYYVILALLAMFVLATATLKPTVEPYKQEHEFEGVRSDAKQRQVLSQSG
eukprot:CAMPEP_0176029678 /NCGR_PEP_ID=MMETSP0120_2-20121206/14586_1 /TAXON_ID=160619 /ORGANISM="Kryptoperidinium foliaceum, Strain CCMP 1326" /LENGTH=462 /DNA_ID=CAMNT_0017362905 /DNA_START=56 /DNA_END=1440 /DNA_ORIENTATION=+